MPEIIKPSQAPVRGNPTIIPITQAPNPHLDYFYDESLDAGYRPGMSQQYVRGNNQAWYTQLGKGVMSRGLSIGTKVTAGIGSVGSALAVPFSDFTVDDIWNNQLSVWANGLDEKLNEVFPIYKTQEAVEGGLLQKLMTTSFWSTDGMDGIAFAASAYAPGGLFSKLGAGAAKAIESGRLGEKVLKGLNTVGLTTKNAGEVAHNASLLLATSYNTVSEAAAEAYQTQKEIETIYLSKGVDPKVAKQKAAEAARTTFGANLAILAIPNYIQNAMFHGAWGSKVAGVRKAAIESNGAASAQGLVDARWKEITQGFASEGLWEENAQTSVQQYERALAKGFTDKGMLGEVTDNLWSNMKGFVKSVLPGQYDITPDEDEGAVAIALGGILGGAFGFMSHRMETKNIEELVKNENETYKTFVKDVLPAASSVLKTNVTSILKANGTVKIKDGDKEIEVPNYEIDENGNWIIDDEATRALVTNSLQNQDFWSLEMVAAMNNNQTLGEFNKEMALASYAYQLASRNNLYSKEDITNILRANAEVGDAEAKRLGINTSIQENMATVERYIDAIEATNNKYQTAKSVNDPNEFGFRSFLRNTDLYLQAKLNAINRIRSSHEHPSLKLLRQLNLLEQDTLAHRELLGDQKRLRNIYDTLVQQPNKYTAEQQKLKEQKKREQEETDRLRELNYLVSEDQFINGTFALMGTGARGNPIGLNTASFIKTTRGAMDDHNEQIGNSWVALRRAEQALNRDEPDYKTAEREFAKVTADVDPTMMADVAARISAPLQEAVDTAQTALAEFEAFNTIKDELNSVEEDQPEGTTWGQLLKPETLATLKIDPDTLFHPDDLIQAQDQLYAEGINVKALQEEYSQALINLQAKLDFIGNYQSRIDEADSEYTKFLNTPNKEEYLKEKFFEQAIKEPTEAFIAKVRKYSESAMDLTGLTRLVDNLKSLIQAYTNRKDFNNPDLIPEATKLLNILENEIRPIILKNLNNQVAHQIIANEQATAGILAALQANEELRQLVKTILGVDDYETVLKTTTGQSYDGVEVLMEQIRLKATKEQSTQFIDYLQHYRDELLQEIYNLVPAERLKTNEGILAAYLTKGHKHYAVIPTNRITNLFKLLFENELEDSASSELMHKFMLDYDFSSFVLSLDNTNLNDVDKDFIRQLHQVHNKVVGVNKLILNTTKSTLKTSELIKLKQDLKLEISPSLQQNIVIDDILNFLSSTTKDERFDNWFLVNGIGGSGKTFVIGATVSKIWPALSGQGLESIIAFSSNKKTSENIQKAVFGKTGNDTLETFMSITDEQLDKTNVLIIDEVFTLTTDQITSINERIIAYHNARKAANKPVRSIKIIALGDASQVTAEEASLLQNTSITDIKSTIPLTTTFRTNVDAIATFAAEYRMKTINVPTTYASANKTPEQLIADPSTALGVAALSEDQILTALNVPSSRSRVLIVPTPEDVAAYKSQFPKLDIVTVSQAQGYQWDEVYVIAAPTVYKDALTANRHLYTAFSRAKAFLAISGADVANNLPIVDMEAQLTSENELLAKMDALYASNLAAAQLTTELFTGTPTVTATDLKQEPVPVTKSEDEDHIPMAPDDLEIKSPVVITPTEPVVKQAGTPPPVTSSTVVHNLEFPQNKSLHPIRVEVAPGKFEMQSPVVLGAPGYILRTKKGTQDFYYVLGTHVSGKFVVLGVLGDEDFKRSPELRSLIIQSSGSINAANINEFAPFDLPQSLIEQSLVTPITLLNATRFKTNYRVEQKAEDPDYPGKDIIDATILRFYDTYFSWNQDLQERKTYPMEVYDSRGNVAYPEKDWVINGEVNWAVLKDKVEVRLMTKKERTEIAKVNPDFNFAMDGLPYLVIKEPKQKGSKKDSPSKAIYIQLQARHLKEDDEILAPIKELVRHIGVIESILGPDYALGTSELEELVDVYARTNFIVDIKASPSGVTRGLAPKSTIAKAVFLLKQDLSPEQSAQLDEALIQLIQLTYGVNLQKKVFDSKVKAEEYLAANATKNSEGNWVITSQDISTDTNQPKTFLITGIEPLFEGSKNFVLKYASSVEDESVTKDYQEYAIQRGQGPAQHKLNALAMANKSVAGIPIRLNISKPEGGTSKRLTRSKSIFDSKKTFDLEGFLSDPRVIEAGWTKDSYNKKEKKTKGNGITQATRFLGAKLGDKEAWAITQQYTITPFTLLLLQAIVDSSQFGDNGHVSLRLPLHLTTHDSQGVNDIGTNDDFAKYRLDNTEVRADLASKMTSAFTGMTRTSVQILLGRGEPLPVSEPEVESTKVSKVLKDLPTLNNPLSNEVKKFLQTLPKIQDIDIHFVDEFKYAGEQIYLKHEDDKYTSITVENTVTGELTIVTGLNPKSIKIGAQNAVDIMLHEILHTATIQAINQGLEDLYNNNKSKTKEAIFVERLTELQAIYNAHLRKKKIKNGYTETASELDIKEFVANLSNENFQRIAKDIEVKSSKGFMSNLLDSVLKALLDFFGGTSNVYDLTFATLKDYYAKPSTQKSVPTTMKSEEFKSPVEQLVVDIKKIADALKDKEMVASLLTGKFDVKKYEATGELEFSKLFAKKSDVSKFTQLDALYQTLLSKTSNLSFAIYNRPKSALISSTGSATNTSYLLNAIESNLGDIWNQLPEHSQNLLYTLLHKQLLEPGTNFLNNLIFFVNNENREAVVDLLWNEILSGQDKKEFKEGLELTTEQDAISYLLRNYQTDPILQILKGVTAIIEGEQVRVENIIGSLEDRMPHIYKEAKNYVLQVIRDNQLLRDSTELPMLTRYSLYIDLLQKVKSVDVSEIQAKLDTAYDQLDELRASNSYTDEYHKLLFQTIPSLENRIMGISSLQTINIRTNNMFVDDIYREIYPKDPLDKIEATELAMQVAELEDATGIVDDDIREAVNISEYIKEYNKSYELTLSESMKDFLATASIAHADGTTKYISPAVMYVKMLQISATLDFTHFNNAGAVYSLNDQVKEKLKGELSSIDRAVYETLATTLRAVILHDDIPKHISIVTGTTAGGNIWYAAARSKTGEDISNLTYEQLKETPNVTLLSTQNATPNLFKELERIYPELTILQFNKLLYRAESINVLRGVMNSMASMRETDLYIGARSYQGGLSTKMMRSKASGITFSIKETIKQALQEKFNNKQFFSSFTNFNNATPAGIRNEDVPQSGSTAQKIAYIKSFYEKVAGLQNINIGISIAADATGRLQDYVTKIKALVDAGKNLSTTLSIPDSALADDSQYVVDPEDIKDDSFTSFISDIDGYLTILSEYASLSSEYLRNPSVRTLRGDRYYKWHESSFAFDTLAAFVDFPSRTSILKGATGSNNNRRVPAHLQSSLYNHNIFVRAHLSNKIHAVGEWEGHLNEDNNSPMEYLRENYNFYYQKKFLQGFLDGIKQYRNSYFQFVYTPADKPKLPLTRVNVLSNDQIHMATVTALEQILEASTWRLNVKNYNKSKQQDLFRNFTIGEEAIKELGIEFNKANIPAIANKAVEIMERRALAELEKLTASDVELRLPTNYAKLLGRELTQKLINPKYSKLVVPTTKAGNFNLTRKEDYQKRREEIIQATQPMFELFFKNNYINGYFLNQLIAGEYAAYSSTDDMTKRYAGVFAPGIKGLVDSNIGMKEHYKVLVLEDTHVDYKNTEEALWKLFFETKTREEVPAKDLAEFDRVMKFFDENGYDMTDAQGFMTPARFRQLGRGFERAWYRGAIHKPVHFEVQQIKVKDAEGNQVYVDGKPQTTGVARYTKYSSIVLSDEMLAAIDSPKLRTLRDNLELMGVDEVLFSSGVKEGTPLLLDETGTPLFTNEKGEARHMTLEEFISADKESLARIMGIDDMMDDDNSKGSSGILTLSNQHFRLQHNPAADTDKQIAIYTQLMYFLDVFSNNTQTGVGLHPSLQKEADKVYQLVADLISLGREEFNRKIDSPAKFRKFLRDKFADTPNGERVAELLEAEISLNNPLIEKKAIIALASGMEKATVRIKFSGAKLVLQTAEGAMLHGEEGLPDRELQYRVDTINNRRVMVAEVFVPESMLTPEMSAALDEGQSIFLYGDALGFRIPSTELHSAVPLKIVGKYSPAGKSNVIIAPKELVPIHGSDFDVDALFVIMRENFSKRDAFVVSAEQITNYQTLMKSFFDMYRKDNRIEELNDIKNRLGLYKDEPITNFVTQADLEDRFTDYIIEPNFDPATRTNIVRGDELEYEKNEFKYRAEWGKLNGYVYEKDEDNDYVWKVSNRLLASMSELYYVVKEEPNYAAVLNTETLRDFSNTFLGQPEGPVGYKKEDGRYVLDDTFLPKIKTQLKALEELRPLIHTDLRNLVSRTIDDSISSLKTLVTKATKNNITESMLSIITNIDENGYRMVTPINFAPLRKAAADNGLDTKKKQADLSDVAQEYEVFYSLSSGAILTGAFANAVKDFAYLTQAGSVQDLSSLYRSLAENEETLAKLNAEFEAFQEMLQADLSEEEKKRTFNLAQAIDKYSKEIAAIRFKITNSRRIVKGTAKAGINSLYHFQIDELVFNSLQMREQGVPMESSYNITEIFDTLINAAIDNLKLGLLGQTKINTQTGSAVVGATFLGVPLTTTVAILNQPILYPLTTGISDKKDQYMRDLIKANPEYEKLPAQITKAELERGLKLSNDPATWSKEDLLTQLRILKIFSNMNKIGEDARHLSKFLSVIRDMQVTVEGLDTLDNVINNNIGTVDEKTGVLVPKANFAFLAPNLLANTPHVLEAYRSHRAIQNFISKTFLLHSLPIRKFTEEVNKSLNLQSSEEVTNAAENLADMRTALSHYLHATVVWPRIANTTPGVRTFKNDAGREVKIGLSITKTYMQQVADRLKAVKAFAVSQGIENAFLDNVYIGTDSLGAPLIQFRGGVNLHPEDHQQIRIDFRNLNRFSIDEFNNVSYATDVTPYSTSLFQHQLVTYAAIAYGLSYGASNYSMYIPASFIRQIDDQYNDELRKLVSNFSRRKTSITPTDAQLQHFKLSYVVHNAQRLPFANYKDVETVYTSGEFDRRKNGAEEILRIMSKDITEKQKVYFDMKVKKGEKNPSYWLKEGSRNRTVAYRLVAESANHAYYQKIGKVNDLFYVPLTEDIYRIQYYYDPKLYTTYYLAREGNVIYSPTPIDHFIKEGDMMYIAPNYNFDRTERTLVKVTKLEKMDSKNEKDKYPGYKYTIEDTGFKHAIELSIANRREEQLKLLDQTLIELTQRLKEPMTADEEIELYREQRLTIRERENLLEEIKYEQQVNKPNTLENEVNQVLEQKDKGCKS